MTGDYLVGSEGPRAARWFLLLLAFRASDGQNLLYRLQKVCRLRGSPPRKGTEGVSSRSKR
jgi:hypothetical protein